MNKQADAYGVNIFRPRQGGMGGEVAVIFLVLVGWGAATFGSQFLIRLMVQSRHGKAILDALTVFHLPFHFWFTGQFLSLWFIILCLVFNLYLDRLTHYHSRRRDRTYE